MNHRNLPQPVNQGTPLRVTIMVEPPQVGLFPVLVTATPTVQAGARYDDVQSLNVIANALRIVYTLASNNRKHDDVLIGTRTGLQQLPTLVLLEY